MTTPQKPQTVCQQPEWATYVAALETEIDRLWEQLTMAFDERDQARRERGDLERRLAHEATS